MTLLCLTFTIALAGILDLYHYKSAGIDICLFQMDGIHTYWFPRRVSCSPRTLPEPVDYWKYKII